MVERMSDYRGYCSCGNPAGSSRICIDCSKLRNSSNSYISYDNIVISKYEHDSLVAEVEKLKERLREDEGNANKFILE